MDWKLHAGRALTATGERFGISALIYHPGVMRMYDRLAVRDAPGFVQRLVAVCGEGRYLDVGAGTGRFAEELRRAGVQADACEHTSQGRKEAAKRGLTMAPFDLSVTPVSAPEIGNYEVAVCLEVAEHIPPMLGHRLVAYLTGAPTVVFTAAHPGQGGTGHINEQPRSYWEDRFRAVGQVPQPEMEQAFLTAEGEVPGRYLLENLMIFRLLKFN